jgi:hypothetical protein
VSSPADVSFAFHDVPDGRWQLVLRSDRAGKQLGEDELTEVDLHRGVTTTCDVDLAPFAPAELRASVLWNGAPLANAGVRLMVSLPDAGSLTVPLVTDADGCLQWTGRAGRVELQFEQAHAVEAIALSPGAVSTGVFQLPGGRLQLRLVDHEQKPATACLLQLHGTPPAHAASLLTDSFGGAETAVDAGLFAVFAQRAASGQEQPIEVHLGEVTITAGQTTEATLRLPAEWPR